MSAPTDDELHALLQTVITRLMKMLTRRGVSIEEMGQTYMADPEVDCEEACTLLPLQAAAVTYRIAFGPRAGQKMLTLRGAMPREPSARQPLCADIDGFSLHAAVRVQTHDRKRLEQLCRYITRPALSDELVQLNAAGQVELKLKTPWRDGTTHLVMSPLEFMQRLAALVPRPLPQPPMTAFRRPMLAVGCPLWVGWVKSIHPFRHESQRPPQIGDCGLYEVVLRSATTVAIVVRAIANDPSGDAERASWPR